MLKRNIDKNILQEKEVEESIFYSSAKLVDFWRTNSIVLVSRDLRFCSDFTGNRVNPDF